jgi:hypothetical protein
MPISALAENEALEDILRSLVLLHNLFTTPFSKVAAADTK